MLENIFLHLEVLQECSAALCILSVFGYPDETLSLVFDVLLQYLQSTCVLPVEIANDNDMINKTLNIIFYLTCLFKTAKTAAILLTL